MPERRDEARPKRRRDAAATREAILEAATRHFATEGYTRAGVREIAADVGVNAALVNRYFGSKEGLFAEVIERAFDIRHLLQDPREDLADHLARVMVCGDESPRDRGYTPLLLLLHCATEPSAVELFRQDLSRTHLRPLARHIGGEGAGARAAMILAVLAGFAMMYHLLRPEAFANARDEKLVALLSRTLAACIDRGPVEAPPVSDPGTRGLEARVDARGGPGGAVPQRDTG